jgi:organic radical activating enzyme
MNKKLFLPRIGIPEHYDYIGVYLTNRCFLTCDYCITNHNDVVFINNKGYGSELSTSEWIAGLNRLELPQDIPITLQGGEPFLHKGIWEILESVHHKMDILTALPPQVTSENFQRLKTLAWNKRSAPYPTIRVSYHKGENDYRELIPRIAELQKIVSIGLFHIDHPGYPEETEAVRRMADDYEVDFRLKEYLGWHDGKMYGTYFYPDAVLGKVVRDEVLCKNSVVPIGPTGHLYRCHSDLYHERHSLAVTHLLDENAVFEDKFRICRFYGLCSECDVKVKNNHNQVFGYTSVEIEFPEQKTLSVSDA